MSRDFGGASRLFKHWLLLVVLVLMGVGRCAQAGSYVLEKTETDFEHKNRGAVNVGGVVKVTDTTHQRDMHETGLGGQVQLDFHATWSFEALPRELKPGQELKVKVSGTCTAADPQLGMASVASSLASDPDMWTGGNYATIGNTRQNGWVPAATAETRYRIPDGPDGANGKSEFTIQLVVDTTVFSTYYYKWQGQSEDLNQIVQRVLSAFVKKKHHAAAVAAAARRPRFATASWSPSTAPRLQYLEYDATRGRARLQLVGQACPTWTDLLRTNTLGDMTPQEAAALEPDVKRIIEASVQKPAELRDILLKFLYSTGEENTEVYRLMMGGEGSSVIFNNLSKTLSPNGKLLRYARGRDRFCRRQQQQDYERFVADGKFAAAFFFATVDLTLNLCDMPVVQGSGLLLSYVQIIQRVCDKDPTLKDTINVDTLKLARDAGLSRPEMPAEITGPFSYTLVFTDHWRAREEWAEKWLNDPTRNLSAATQASLDEAPSEGAWLDGLDNKREELGRAYVLNRALRGAFDAIFAEHHWELEPLTFFNSPEHREHVMARREVIRRMDEARAQIPAVAYYGGWVAPDAMAPN